MTGILSERSQQVNSLLLSANDLLAVLEQRRYAIVNLLANTSAMSQQLTGLVRDNEQELAPTLEKLNSVSEMLERNRDNIAKALNGLAKYQVTQGEAVNNGFYYNAFIGNLLPGGALQPFLDYALGYRRGVNAGQPPDNAGPRAEFPFPTTVSRVVRDDRPHQIRQGPHRRAGGAVGLRGRGPRSPGLLRTADRHRLLHLGHLDLSR